MDCDELFDFDEELMGTPRETFGVLPKFCPECGSEMVTRKGPRGEFLGCSAYPSCPGSFTYALPKEESDVYAKLTLSTGNTLWVDPEHISCVVKEPNNPNCTMILVGFQYYCVKESVAEVLALR